MYKIKKDSNGIPQRYKARLVAQGFTQQYGIDYDEIFAPVVKNTTFRTQLSIAGKRKLILKHWDAKTAFLNGELKEIIYMKQPPGFEDEKRKDWGCRLNETIYGLKQAAKVWYEKLKSVLNNLNFQVCDKDLCLFKTIDEGPTIYVVIHIDDMVVACQSLERIESLKAAIDEQFTIVDLSDLKMYLGIEVRRDDAGDIYVNQRDIQKIIERTKLTDAKGSMYPLDPGYQKLKAESKEIKITYYQRVIGFLLYIAVNTRPDISAAVSILSQHIIDTKEVDWLEVKRVCRYLKYTIDYELKLSNNESENNKLIGFADANWAECRIDRKSNTGYIFQLFDGAISWVCKKQSTVTLSMAEAELMALCEAAREAVWIKYLLEFFDEPQTSAITLFEDNQSVINSLKTSSPTNRTKHVDVKYFYTKNLQGRGIVDVQYCPTELNRADMLTKPLQSIKIKNLANDVGLKVWK